MGLCFSLNSMAEQASSISGLTSRVNNLQAITALKKPITAGSLEVKETAQTNSVTPELVITKNTTVKKRNLADRLQQINHFDYSFSIFQANTHLVDDYDADGYYQTFSVTFDADILTYSLFDQADVYAQLYLSFNGGPWQHYLTTDVFTLYGESSDDEYSIHTRLDQGYLTGEYDVLIDLYEVGYTDIVATYSALDDIALIALPLESEEYDIAYVEQSHTDIHHYGGSINVLMVSALFIFSLFRLRVAANGLHLKKKQH